MVAFRFVRTVCAAAAMAALGVTAAAAATDPCPDLQSRLAVLDRSMATYDYGGDRVLDAAILRQQQAFDEATVEARRDGCIAGPLFRAHPSAKCGSLMATVDRMQANLARLSAQRKQISVDPFSAASERADLLRQLGTNDCGDSYAAYATPQAPRPSLFGDVLTGGAVRSLMPDGTLVDEDSLGPGMYRTLCVRTCDGYYFPISFATTPERFGDDEQACQAMCPGAPVSLYVHRNPGEDSEAMVSLAGRPYTDLPTAFLYRQRIDPTCVCHPQAASLPNATPIPGQPGVPEETAARPLPLPVRGRGLAVAAARTGGLAQLSGPVSRGRPVRVVGPSYYIAR